MKYYALDLSAAPKFKACYNGFMSEKHRERDIGMQAETPKFPPEIQAKLDKLISSAVKLTPQEIKVAYDFAVKTYAEEIKSRADQYNTINPDEIKAAFAVVLYKTEILIKEGSRSLANAELLLEDDTPKLTGNWIKPETMAEKKAKRIN